MKCFVLATALLSAQESAAPAAVERGAITRALSSAPPDSAPPATFLVQARDAAPELFGILRDGTLPDPAEDRAMPLAAQHERWILDALRALGRRDVLGLVRTELAQRDDPGTRAAALRLVGAVGNGGDLQTLFTLALPEGDTTLGPRAGEALPRALAEVFARDGRALEQVTSRWRSLPAPLIEPLLLSLGAAPRALALEFLVEVLHWRREHAALVLARVQELGRSLDPQVDGLACARIQPLLDPAHPELCRAAALALGALQDLGSIPALIALLAESSTGLRTNAHWALRRITGLALPAEPEVWGSWYAQESAWLERAAPAALRRLAVGDASELAEAFRELAQHPLAREELARALLERLEGEPAAVRVVACRALGACGDARAFPGLLARLEDSDAEVVSAAGAALRELTGRDLPPIPRVWAAALGRLRE